MVTLKEYKIYLKVKKFIETIDCEENDIIPKLMNGVGIIPAYVPFVIESDDMEQQLNITLYQLLLGVVELLNKRSFMLIEMGELG